METQTEGFVNTKALRGIQGKSQPGKKNRRDIKITLTPETVAMLNRHVRIGPGSYGSPFIELSVRLLLAMIDNGEDIQEVAADIKRISRSPYLSNNVRLFKETMEK